MKFCNSHIMSSINRTVIMYHTGDIAFIRCLNCGVDRKFHIGGSGCLDKSTGFSIDFITPQDFDHIFFRHFHNRITDVRAFYE